MPDSIMAGATTPASTLRATPAPRLAIGLGVTRLHIDEGATAMQLADDCQALFCAGLDALETMSEEAAGPGVPHAVREVWWAMLYSMRAAHHVLNRWYEVTAETDRRAPK